MGIPWAYRYAHGYAHGCLNFMRTFRQTPGGDAWCHVEVLGLGKCEMSYAKCEEKDGEGMAPLKEILSRRICE